MAAMLSMRRQGISPKVCQAARVQAVAVLPTKLAVKRVGRAAYICWLVWGLVCGVLARVAHWPVHIECSCGLGRC